MTHDEIIAVVTAHRDGADVEHQAHGGQWRFTGSPLWEFGVCDYRVKPAPFVCWANFYSTGDPIFHPTREEADAIAMQGRIRCVKMIEAEGHS